MRNPLQAVGQKEPGKLGRNDPCSCGSGRKFKNCCAAKPPAFAPTASIAPGPASGSDDRLRQASTLRDAGRFLEAARLNEAYVRERPLDPVAHSELGILHLHAGRPAQAAASLMQAVRLAPRVATHHYNLASALESLGRDQEAIMAFRQALALSPRDQIPLERLGNLLLTHGQRAEATGLFARAAAAAPDTVAGRMNHAKVLIEDGRLSDAEAFLRQTVASHPDSAEAQRFLANVLREQGRFEAAIPLLEQATEGSPALAANAYFDLAQSKRITADDQPMLDQMQALLNLRGLSDKYRIPLHFGLSKAFDDLQDYQQAMRHADAANGLAKLGRHFDRAHYGASVGRLIGAFDRDALTTPSPLGSDSDRPLFILGMPRSGTTLVEQIVSSHPEIAAGGELTFWNQRAAAIAQTVAAAGANDPHAGVAGEYLAVLGGMAARTKPDALRVTDKQPGNFLWIGLIHTVFPNARFIHCRRHPVDTCLSNYFTYFAAHMPFTNDKGNLAFYYRWYERLMAHWHAALPRGRLLDVDYQELVADPDSVSRQMIEFVGLPWDDACLRPQDNRAPVKTASMWQARQPTYRSSTERWRRYQPWLGELATLLQPEDLAQPVSDNPKLPAAYRLRESGRFDEAIAALRDAMRQAPNDPVVYNDLGALCLATNRIESAVDCFEKAIGLCPHFAAAHYNLGAAQERQGRTTDAIRSLRQAILFSPGLGAAHSRLGNLLQAAGATEEAKTCFRRAAELMATPAERLLEEAKLLVAEGRASEAEPLLQSVIAQAPDNSLALTILGDLLGEAGRFSEAVELLKKATTLDPERVGAWYNLTVLTKFGAGDRPLADEIAGVLNRPGRTDFDRTLLHFALGKAHDDLGDYEKAIGHYDKGNALERAKLTFDRIGFAAEIDRIIATFTPDRFVRPPGQDSSSELPVCIVGMPRSGTTLVEQIVSAHSEVAPGGELTFWETGTPAHGSAYLDLLHGIGPNAVRVTDKNPFNFLRIGTIHQALPNARFIHCRRNPIDTCLSIYFTRFATQQTFAYDRDDLVFYYRQYQRLMAHWRAVMPQGRLLEIDYETLTADRDTQTRRMIGFIGLDWDDSCLIPEQNQRVVRTASVWQARQPVYRGSVERWRRYQPWLGALSELQCGEN